MIAINFGNIFKIPINKKWITKNTETKVAIFSSSISNDNKKVRQENDSNNIKENKDSLGLYDDSQDLGFTSFDPDCYSSLSGSRDYHDVASEGVRNDKDYLKRVKEAL